MSRIKFHAQLIWASNKFYNRKAYTLIVIGARSNEIVHEILVLVTSASGQGSDEPGHQHSLTRV